MRTQRPWAPDEVAYLTEQYERMPIAAIMDALNRSKPSVDRKAQILRLRRVRTLATLAINRSYFTDVTTDEQAYILGVIAADGNVTHESQLRITLHERDLHLVEWIRDRIAPLSPIRQHYTSHAVVFGIQSQQIAYDLSVFGIVPNKTYSLEWPSALDGSLSRPFLLGAFDGDGSLYLNRRGHWKPALRWALYGREGFLSSCIDVIEAATGIRAYGPRRMRSHSAGYAIELGNTRAEVVDRWLNQDRMGLARKHL